MAASCRDTGHILVAHQPAYLPWPGYFSRLLDVDRFLVLDHVQFSGGWQQRNRIRGQEGSRQLLTVPVHQHHGQPITAVRIAGDQWRHRHWRILVQAYRRAPYWPQWEPRLEAIYEQTWEFLAPLNLALTGLLLDGFSIHVELVTSSSLQPGGCKTSMLIGLCRLTGATVLRVGSGALAYLDAGALREAGVGIQVATYSDPPYRQHPHRPFLPGLSALDLLLRRGPQARAVLEQGSQIRPQHGLATPA